MKIRRFLFPQFPVRYSFFALLFSFSLLPFSFSAEVSSVQTYDQLLKAIRETRNASEAKIEQLAEQEKVKEAWQTGKLIDEHILLHKERAEYGKQVVIRLAKDLETSETELNYMLEFVRDYPIPPAPGELSWSHYRELMALADTKEREELAKQAEAENWSQKELRRKVKAKRKSSASKNSSLPFEEDERLPEVNPGRVGMYRVSLAILGPYKGSLVLDLGFDNFYKITKTDGLHSGDLVMVQNSRKDFYDFTKVYSPSSKDKVWLNRPKNAIFAGEAELYTYRAEVARVIDGDTFEALIDLGFGITTGKKIRLEDLDAPELITGDGKEAKEVLEKILKVEGGGSKLEEKINPSTINLRPSTPVILIQSKEMDQHGRALAQVWVNGKNIAQELLDSGLYTIRQED